MQKHDKLWKELLRAFFPEFLELVVPQVAAELDGTQCRFLDQESFTDHKDGLHVRMDLVAEIPIRGDQQSLVIVHTEVERDFGVAMDRRTFRYFAHLKLKFDRPVIPIVLFLRGGPAGIERRTFTETLGDFVVNEFTYNALGLSRATLDDVLTSSPLGAALGSCTRGDKLPPYERKFRCIEAILDAEVDDAQQILLLNAVETYLDLDDEQNVQYNLRVDQSPKREEVLEMEMTWADRLRETGRLEGLETGRLEGLETGRLEGLETGRAEGARAGLSKGAAVARHLLLELLTSRFGNPPAELRSRVESLEDLAEIAAWSERVLQASTLAELQIKDLPT